MNRRFTMLLSTLLISILYVSCTSIYQPDPGEDIIPDPGGSFISPVLSEPADGANGLSTNVVLKWEEVQDASSYSVQVSLDEEFTDIFVDSTTTSTQFEPEALQNNTSYFWRVGTATDSVSEWSESRSFTTVGKDDTTPPPSTGSSDIWVSAYFASWNHYAPPGGNWGNIPTEAIDWDAFTHLIYFAMSVNINGSLSRIAAYENMSPDRINAIVSAAHDHGKPVLMSVGGWGNYDGFSQAISPGSRNNFVQSLVSLIETWGFDGVDLDMEPINGSDKDNYKAFVRDLHAAFQNVTTPLGDRPLLTAATSWSPDVFSDLQQYFDQINLMTYDFSGAWEGWASWHNAAVYDGGQTFPGTNRALPSVDGKLQSFINAGVDRSKLGIGIDFYGYVWHGQVTEPGQTWSTAPRVEDNVPYYTIMNNYYNSGSYHWDSDAQGAYLSIDNADPSQRKFISYDDEKSVQAKIDYTHEQEIGGVIIWELGGGYRSNQPAGSRDKLLQSVKNAVQQ